MKPHLTATLFLALAAFTAPASAETVLEYVQSLGQSQGGFAGKLVKTGTAGTHVGVLRKALNEAGYSAGRGNTADSALINAIRSFQEQEGMEVDGIAGRDTWEALGYEYDNSAFRAPSANEKRALTVWGQVVNRWTIRAQEKGYSKLVIVNIPTQTLHAIDTADGNVDLHSKVIVGTPRSKTPIMSTRIVNLKFNPDWTPTASMPGKRYTRPGPNNPLGSVRFSTDNRMHIYLHDTNQRGLFSSGTRAFSHGCVRVDDWAGLAAWASDSDESYIQQMVSDDYVTRYAKIDPIPVIFSYSLVDVVPGGWVSGTDIYGRGQSAIGARALAGADERMADHAIPPAGAL